MSAPVRVVLVDDDPLVRAALATLLATDGTVQIVGQAGDGDEALLVVGRAVADVVLMDIRMPGRDGLWATRALMARPNPPHVIILTTLDSDDLLLQALAAGAQGFLLKESAPPHMLEAIHAVMRGEPILSPRVTQRLIEAATKGASDERRAEALASLAVLTEREEEVALAVGRGLTNVEIAGDLFMAPATVKGYLTRIFTKLGLSNRVQVAIRVHDAGLV